MPSVNERIAALRARMKQAGVQAYLVPSSDPHMSEYPPDHWQARKYFSGFGGSAGTLVVTEQKSGLWTDGRYFIQAARELEGSEVELFRMSVAGVPTYPEFLEQTLGEGDTVGFDGKVMSASDVEGMCEKFGEKHLGIKSVDLVSDIWENRPPMPHSDVFVHDAKYAGFTCAQKLAQVRERLKKEKADGQLYIRLDCVGWLMDIRADDILYNPLAMAYAAVFSDAAYLYIDRTRVLPETMEYLRKNGVTVMDYGAVYGGMENLSGKKRTVLVDKAGTNYELYRILKENPSVTVREGEDIVTGLKGVKNGTEIRNILHAHVLDGCAMVKFRVALADQMARGETVTECTVCDMLKKFRAEQPGNMGESFGTIAAYRENAAMMHYEPKPGACRELKNEGFLLVDSGGQYQEGTTDITRTFVLGPVSREEKEHYTYVLKSHIALATAVFLEGCTGGNIDILSREQVWKHGIDYRCGTGHGVGMFANVHEGPQNLRISNRTVFRSGMTVTNEPGIYEEGKHGIRTENLMLVADAFENEYGRFLKFETVTCFPIDTAAILPELMTPEELGWLNGYHRTVREKLSPMLSGKELEWLEENTRPFPHG